MASFNGGDVVIVPLPSAPEMVVWAVPGEKGDVPYAETKSLVKAEVAGQVTYLETLVTAANGHQSTAVAAQETATLAAADAEESKRAALEAQAVVEGIELGQRGVGIESITVSEDKKGLIFLLTSGVSQYVELPGLVLAPVEPTKVGATAPTWTNNPTNGGGSWTTPNITGIAYSPASGTATPSQTVVVTATALPGYALIGGSSWTYTFPAKPVEVPGTPTKVVAIAPAWVDDPEVGGGHWSGPVITGITYTPASGFATPGQSVTVTATANSGYVIEGTSSWTHTFPASPVTPSRYYDVAPILSSIDQGKALYETGPGVSFLNAYGLTGGLNVNTVGGPITSGLSAYPIHPQHPNINWGLKRLVTELAKYPPSLMKASALDKITLTGIIYFDSDPSREAGGVAPPGEYFQAVSGSKTVTGRFYSDGFDGVVLNAHHEIQHVLAQKHNTYFDNIRTEWESHNQEPYIGLASRDRDRDVRPPGHMRTYGLSSYAEDQADIFTLLMTTELQSIYAPIIASDPGLAAKLELMRKWFATLSPETAKPDYFGQLHLSGAQIFTDPKPVSILDTWTPPSDPEPEPEPEPIEVVSITGQVDLESQTQFRAALTERGWSHTTVTELPFELDLSQATTAQGLFSGCAALTSVPVMNTSNVTNMRSMFFGCTALTSVPAMDTANVTTMHGMFNNCSALASVPSVINTSNVTTMDGMFYGCAALTSVPSVLDTSKVTTMAQMFYNCNKLTAVPAMLNTSSVTTMANMFFGCIVLTSVPAMDTSNVTNMSGMFKVCSKLVSIPSMNTVKVTTMVGMFENCSALQTVGDLSAANVSVLTGTFYSTPSLRDGAVRLIGKRSTVQTTDAIKFSGLTRIPFFDTAGNPI